MALARLNNTEARCKAIYTTMVPAEPRTPNHAWLAKIIASWIVGNSALPDCLGLSPDQFEAMRAQYFPDTLVPCKALLSTGADYSDMPEKNDLKQLLIQGNTTQQPETEWISELLINACLGADHLWQDLGLWERKELTALMRYNFPLLAARNDKNMRWKKFLYKQLCEAEGIYVCRSPSCEVCEEYSECFDRSAA